MRAKKLWLIIGSAAVLAVGLTLTLVFTLRCGHKNVSERITAATCTQTGTVERVCERCGKVISTETIAALGHDWGAYEVTAPTLEADGSKSRVCGRDATHTETVVLPKLNERDYVFSVTTEPTCTVTGAAEYASDEYGTWTVELPRLPHSFGGWTTVRPSTCTQAGTEKRTCSVCDTAEERTLALLPHSFGEWTTARPSTCSQAGAEKRTCSVCDTIEERALPLLPHTLEDGTCSVCGTKVYSAGITYNLSADGTYYIVSDTEHRVTDTKLIIPAEHNGKPVGEIAAEGFAERTWLESVHIPESIVKIGDGAFSQAGLTEIYYDAARCADFNARNWVFYPAAGPRSISVTFGPSVERIPARLFYPLVTEPDRNPAVTRVAFDEKCAVEEIGAYAFYKLKGLTAAALPVSVRSVGDYAFYATGLTHMALGDAVETIGVCAFGACTALTSVTFGRALSSISADAFNFCTSLKAVDLGATSVETLGADAFKNCTALLSADLGPAKVIGAGAFSGCTALGSVAWGEGLTQIGASAFADCAALAGVRLPSALKNLGDGAFKNCTGLTSVIVACGALDDLAAGNGCFENGGALSGGMRVTVDAERVAKRLFFPSSEVEALPRIASLELTGAVKTIGAYAFNGYTGEVVYHGTAAAWAGVEAETGNAALDRIVCRG